MNKSIAAIITFVIILIIIIIGGVPVFDTVWSFPGNFDFIKNLPSVDIPIGSIPLMIVALLGTGIFITFKNASPVVIQGVDQLQTEFGTYRLKFFFSESLSTESGEEVSTREVKKILSDLIEAENKKHPLSDESLTELLQEKGYNIARRTVAKYREQLNIPVARLRKEL